MQQTAGGFVFKKIIPNQLAQYFNTYRRLGGPVFVRTFWVVLLGLLQVGLQELGEGPLLCEQLLVAAALRYLSVLQHDDLIHLGQERDGVGHKHASLKCWKYTIMKL